MNWVQPITVSSPIPPSQYATETPNNLATDRFDPRRAWGTQTTLAACSLIQDAAAIGDIGAPRQLPYSILPSSSETSLKAQETSPNTMDDIRGLQDHAIPAFTCQINLATGSNSGDNIGHTVVPYQYPPGFHSSFGQTIYQQYTDNSTVMQIGDANAQTPRDFGYGYTESPVPTQTSQRFEYNDFQPASDGSYLGTQPLDELYPGDRRTVSFHAEYPYHSSGSFSERRVSAPTLQESEVQPPFIISFNGTPLEEDSWSSAAFSSPSLGSFDSSPPSTQHDSSALGTPSQGFEDASVSHAEPLLNHPISYSISDLRRLSNSPAGSDSPSPQFSRRGAVSHQGLCVVPSQAGSSGRPSLDDTMVRHVYAESFESEDVSDYSQGPLASESAFTPATSPSTSIGFDYPLATDVSTGSSKPSKRGNTATGTTSKNDPSHVVPSIRQLSSKSAEGNGQNGGPRHHPYGRSARMSAHEQVIQFDNPPSAVSTVGVSDHTEPESRKSKKKSKGSKRVFCEYICPLKREPCGQSVSREADMSRHMQRHRRAEETLVREGHLSPDQQTKFENLKADEITLCKRCGETLSRKDALRRHLKNAGKACRSFYPEIVIS
ncbi:unnamed protein product [Rhizoctonia solani]|uniref:C2H2-type domain-containing protein n=1 Tax=Rhizoctonia solani TaxID=456999 RepID=A0A8H3CXG1_9AGAM|nr:unnamed protein product [Rhizoctonia solani]